MQSLDARTWLAVRGKPPDDICRDLGLRQGMEAGHRGGFALFA